MSKRSDLPIKSIWGFEPPREGEYPQTYIVGEPCGLMDATVAKITFRTDIYGDHGLGWFDIWVGDDVIASMAARAVSEVHYDPDFMEVKP